MNPTKTKRTLADRFPVGKTVTAAASGQMMTPGQVRSLYGKVKAVDLVARTVAVTCDDGRVRTWPANTISRVLGA